MIKHDTHHNILGTSLITSPIYMIEFVKNKNANAIDIEEIASCYLEVGSNYGIRGDIAYCQAILETGWFTYEGSAVLPVQHNYCGLGVTSKGEKGHSFPNVLFGVIAHIQHLYAYASTNPIPPGEFLVDPRFSYVKRGSAPHWEDLNEKWAMNKNYGEHILRIYADLIAS